MNSLLPPEIAMVVGPEEHVVWTGHAGRVGPGAAGWYGGCFGAFFGGFALFWIAMAAGITGLTRKFSGPGSGFGLGVSLFPLFGVPFLLVGIYIVGSSLYWGPRRRGSGIYAVTDRRLLFIRTFPKMVVKEIPLSRSLRIEQTLDANGGGTLAFADPVSIQDPEGMTVNEGRYGGRSVYRSENPYSFLNIPDAVQVARMIQGMLNG